MVDIRLFHLAEKLAGIGGKRLDVAPLTLGEDGVEGKRRFPRARKTGDDDEFIAGNVYVDILEIVLPRAANRDPVNRLWHGMAFLLTRPGLNIDMQAKGEHTFALPSL